MATRLLVSELLSPIVEIGVYKIKSSLMVFKMFVATDLTYQ